MCLHLYLSLFLIFLALPGRLCISAVSLLAGACKAYCQQLTDTEGLSGSKLPGTMGRIIGQKSKVTKITL